MYITLEGIPGVGKSTQIRKLIAYLRKKYPQKTFVFTHEPGGSEIGADIRKIVQGKNYNQEMSKLTEALLYTADRAQLLLQLVIPALKAGEWVFSDRSFVSSLVFQGIGYGLGLSTVWRINRLAVLKQLPDLIIFFAIDPSVAKSRVSDASGDKHESNSLKFYQDIAKGYLTVQRFLAKVLGNRMRWETIDASGTEDQVFQRILAVIEPLLEES